jgi:hypothetical protein
VLVGTEEKKFVFHKDILCIQSGFFAAAFKTEWMTAEDQPLRLTEEDPEIFKAFFYWIYRNRIIIPETVYDKGARSIDGPYGLLAKLWILGDMYQIKSLQNDAIDGFIRYHQDNTGLPAEVISFVYENTFQPSCGIRKLLVCIAEYHYEAEDMDPEKTYFPPEFLLDMVRRGLEYRYASCHPRGLDKYTVCRRDLMEAFACQKWLDDNVCIEYHEHDHGDGEKEKLCPSIKAPDMKG